MITKAYACYNLDEDERVRSSSGGVYPLIAKQILAHNGVVYAACYDDNLEVIHNRINTEDGLRASQGSKYVQSKIGNTFASVVQDMRGGKDVLFVGTPCQCAGLDSYIKGLKLDRTCLILMDFVCHGVPSNVAWKSYKNKYIKNNDRLITINMRDKSTGWRTGNYAWREVTASGKVSVTPRRQVSYMKGMLANLFIRQSCFECQFKGIDRVTDFTLGDFWGVEKCLPELDDDKGTSLVLVHTEKGLSLFESIHDKIMFAAADISKAVEGNACLEQSTKYNPKREEFFRRFNSGEEFVSIIDALTRVSIGTKVINKMKNIIKKPSRNSGGGIRG